MQVNSIAVSCISNCAYNVALVHLRILVYEYSRQTQWDLCRVPDERPAGRGLAEALGKVPLN